MIAERPLRLIAASMPQQGSIDHTELARAAENNSKSIMFPDTQKPLTNRNWAQSFSPLTDTLRREAFERQLAESVTRETQVSTLPLRRGDRLGYSSSDWQGLLFFPTEYTDSSIRAS